MSGICGWIGHALSQDEAISRANALTRPLQRFNGGDTRTLTGNRSALSQVARKPSNILRQGALLVAMHGAPMMTNHRSEKIDNQQSVAQKFAICYAREGMKALERLSGTFSLAVIDEQQDELLLAVDRIGACTLSFAKTKDGIVFASIADALLAHPEVESDVNLQSIYDYVHFHMIPAPGSAFASQQRLLPGQYLKFSGGRIELRTYWKINYTEDARLPFSDLKVEFMRVLRSSMKRAAETESVGAFLSGGTDSSTIAGLLSEVCEGGARTYSIGFQEEGYDEIQYARIAARHFGTKHHEYYVTPDDVVDCIPRIAEVHDQPFGNSSAVPTYYCARLAASDGVDTLLGGDGGDELFGGNSRYALQYYYSLYGDLPVALRKNLIEPLLFLGQRAPRIVEKARRYVLSASQSMPARYDNYNLLERLGAATVFTEDFLERIDQTSPLRQSTLAYNEIDSTSLINRMLALDLKYTLADNDLPKVVRSCELAGVDVRFPLLDDAVVEFSARLAPDLKLRRARLRYFFKKALRDFLPREIIVKKKHGFGLPFGPWLQSHKPLQQIVGDSLQSLKRRGIVRSDFIDMLLGELMRSHAGYYGTMAWILMMLEQWYERQESRPVDPKTREIDRR